MTQIRDTTEFDTRASRTRPSLPATTGDCDYIEGVSGLLVRVRANPALEVCDVHHTLLARRVASFEPATPGHFRLHDST